MTTIAMLIGVDMAQVLICSETYRYTYLRCNGLPVYFI